MSELDLHRTRSQEARASAAPATLQNVRERCTCAAEAWDAMARRAAMMERRRATAAKIRGTHIAE